MKTSKLITRRNFIEKAAVTTGLAAWGANPLSGKPSGTVESPGKLPREVWIATVSQHGLNVETPEEMVQIILAIIKKSITYHPDVICLPEVFMTSNIAK